MKDASKFFGNLLLFLAIGLFALSAVSLLKASEPRDIYCNACFPTRCPNGMCSALGSVTATDCKITGCDNEAGYIVCRP